MGLGQSRNVSPAPALTAVQKFKASTQHKNDERIKYSPEHVLKVIEENEDNIIDKLLDVYTSYDIEGKTTSVRLKNETLSGKNILIQSYKLLNNNVRFYSPENVDFLAKVDKYKSTLDIDEDKAKTLAIEIINDHLLPNATQLVNIPNTMMKSYEINFEDLWKKPKKTLFDEPYQEVTMLMVGDISSQGVLKAIEATLSDAIKFVIQYMFCYCDMIKNAKTLEQKLIASCSNATPDEIINLFVQLFGLDDLFGSQERINCSKRTVEVFGSLLKTAKVRSDAMAKKIVKICNERSHIQQGHINQAKAEALHKVKLINMLKPKNKIAPMTIEETPIEEIRKTTELLVESLED